MGNYFKILVRIQGTSGNQVNNVVARVPKIQVSRVYFTCRKFENTPLRGIFAPFDLLYGKLFPNQRT